MWMLQEDYFSGNSFSNSALHCMSCQISFTLLRSSWDHRVTRAGRDLWMFPVQPAAQSRVSYGVKTRLLRALCWNPPRMESAAVRGWRAATTKLNPTSWLGHLAAGVAVIAATTNCWAAVGCVTVLQNCDVSPLLIHRENMKPRKSPGIGASRWKT